MGQQSAIFINFTILLVAALVGGMVAHRLKQPVILGYLIVGVVIGPYSLKLVNDTSLVTAAATIGVALLMLTLGLEVSFVQIKQVGKVGLLGGIIQILVTIGLGIAAALIFFHWALPQAVLFGLIISLSSTMVCMKILMDRGELDSTHGRIMMAILILQDIASVLMIIVEPLLGHTEQSLWLALAKALGGGVLFIVIAIVAGLWVLPWLMGRVGGVRSRELFLLSVLVLCLGAAVGTEIFGLSAVFGAFLVGLVLRETRFAHQALAEITPLRDIFAALFFVSLGMLLDPLFVFRNWQLVLVTVVIILIIKFIVVAGIVRSFGYGLSIAMFAGLGLFQIGEFSFILAQGGVNINVLSQESYALIIGASVITMLLTPFTLGLAGKLQSTIARAPQKSKNLASEKPVAKPGSEPTERIVIAGFGRVGQSVAQVLEDTGIPFSIIEIDPEVIFRAHCGGNVCIYGDASNTHVLSKLDLNKADLLIVTFPDPVAVLTTVKTALSINPRLKIIARAHRERDAAQLKRLGIQELISPEYEASLEFIRRILHITGRHKEDIKLTMNKVLQDHQIEEFESDEDHYQPWL
jgi:CPA2 family monovalent cation:H+ antiporter-2